MTIFFDKESSNIIMGNILVLTFYDTDMCHSPYRTFQAHVTETTCNEMIAQLSTNGTIDAFEYDELLCCVLGLAEPKSVDNVESVIETISNVFCSANNIKG